MSLTHSYSSFIHITGKLFHIALFGAALCSRLHSQSAQHHGVHFPSTLTRLLHEPGTQVLASPSGKSAGEEHFCLFIANNPAGMEYCTGYSGHPFKKSPKIVL